MLCAVRIHMLNESDLDVVCPSTSGAFWTSDGNDKRCEGGGFNWTRPISIENENKTITGELKNVQSLSTATSVKIFLTFFSLFFAVGHFTFWRGVAYI